MMFSDATILTETPPLRACWSLVGRQAEVPITGNRDKRVVFGALNPRTGAAWFDESAKWDQDAFQNHLRSIRSRWRGWHLVLFVGRGSPHTAKRSRALAAELGIELRFLPTACPELNPVEGLWRHVKAGDGQRADPGPERRAECTTRCSRWNPPSASDWLAY